MEEKQIEQKESIKLTKNAKGDFQWEIKLHFDDVMNQDSDTLERLKTINGDLQKDYGKTD